MVDAPKLKSRGAEPDSVDNLEVDDRKFAKAVRKLANTPPAPSKPQAELKKVKSRRARVAVAKAKPAKKKGG